MNTIKVKYGLEDITARVPGLFPYIEFDENHVSTVHAASDSDVGCYGKIACALTIPNDVSLTVADNGSNRSIIVAGLPYTYKTLMSAYYKYRDDYPTNSFIKFMEKGIGKFKITANIDFEYCTLVPEYEYYANCARLWDEYTKISIMCSKYQLIKEATGEVNCELECLVEKYAKMGGDIMKDYYGNLVNNANAIAAEYYGYLSNEFNLNFDLNITASENDLGILNTFIEFFGTKYVNALYVVEGNTVVRVVRQVDPQDPTHPISQDTMTSDKKYYTDDTCILEASRGVDYFLPGDLTIYDDRTYVCEQPTMNGEWDASRFHLINENYLDQTPDYNTYYNPNTGSTPSTELNATSNSKLNGFIGELRYTDESGTVRTPDNGTDWLWYYRIGRIGFSETITDRFNNIEIQSGYTRNENIGQYETHLMAYGDIITNIERTQDENNSTLTITYVIGAHFKSKLAYTDFDDDGNAHYYYGDYEYDSNDTHGVKYVETYLYNTDSEIYNMSDEFFEYFVTHDKNELDRNNTTISPSIIIGSRYTKGAFRLDTNVANSDILVNGYETSLPYIISDYSTSIQLSKDSIVNPLTKFDYLGGVAYNPSVQSDVHISRGNASAWERHIKLSEIKSFDDLDTYSNGGFFNLR